MTQWKLRKKYNKLRIGKEQSHAKDWKSSTTEAMNQQDESVAKRYKPGKLLSCDKVGPIKSFDVYVQPVIYMERCKHRAYVLLFGQGSIRGCVPGRHGDHPLVLQEALHQD